VMKRSTSRFSREPAHFRVRSAALSQRLRPSLDKVTMQQA
jgi:hypothetical protein